MRFYTGRHRFYCGIDLHARSMFLCILDSQGNVLVHKNIKATPEDFLNIVAPYREDLVVAVECIFSWYWLADLCAREKIPFILGHALYMKAIHGGKSKNDKPFALKIATLLRGGMIPQAYVYPAQMRATRDLLRRRMHLMRKRAELLAHIQNTTSQYNLPEFEKVIAYRKNREGIADLFPDPTVRASITADLELIDLYDDLLKRLVVRAPCSAPQNRNPHHAKALEPHHLPEPPPTAAHGSFFPLPTGGLISVSRPSLSGCLGRILDPLAELLVVHVLVCLVTLRLYLRRNGARGIGVAILVFQVVDLHCEDSVSARDRLVDFVVDVRAPRRLAAHAHDRHRRVLQALVDEGLDRRVSLLLGLLPDGRVLEACGSASRHVGNVADLVHAPDVALIVKTEEHSAGHW